MLMLILLYFYFSLGNPAGHNSACSWERELWLSDMDSQWERGSADLDKAVTFSSNRVECPELRSCFWLLLSEIKDPSIDQSAAVIIGCYSEKQPNKTQKSLRQSYRCFLHATIQKKYWSLVTVSQTINSPAVIRKCVFAWPLTPHPCSEGNEH